MGMTSRWLITLGLFGIAAIASVALAAEGPADAVEAPDYLPPELRSQVEQLKGDFDREPTTADNLEWRRRVVWSWINAYSLTGGPVPTSAPGVIARRTTVDGDGRAEDLDALIHEMRLKDELPGALGEITLRPAGPFAASSRQTIEQTYTVGELPIAPGGVVLVGQYFLSDQGTLQTEDTAGDNYVSLRWSNRQARFDRITVPLRGIHGGFRGAQPMIGFRLMEGELSEGDTLTVVYGDRSGGSRGFQMQSSQNDRIVLPLYLDPDGSGLFLPPSWPSYAVHGIGVHGVRGVAPSIVATGEPFDLVVRSEDLRQNRATGPIPEYEVTLDGEPYRTIAAGREAISVVEGVRLEAPGVYRFNIRSTDGTISGTSNPIWVRDDPPRRIYWGDTHAHSGFADGQGSVDGLYRYAREDARLDFFGFSEHDTQLDAAEWLAMRSAVDRYNTEHEFVAFLAYEWSANRRRGGHHNVFFRSRDGEPAPMQDANTLSLMYQGLRVSNDVGDVLIIPHAHQAADWRRNDPDMERLVEIVSMHGTFEWFGDYYLRRGFEIGFVGSSDDHRGRPGYTGTANILKFGERLPLQQFGGLAAVLASDKTTDSIFDAMRDRAAYAVAPAERIILDMRLNGGRMGSRQPFAAERRIACRVMGTAPIDQIDVVKNGEVVFAKHYLSQPIEAHAWVQVRLASSSEPFARANPREYRTWRGTLRVDGAELVGFRPVGFDNRYAEEATLDPAGPNRIGFVTDTRGRADILLLELSGASTTTSVEVHLDETKISKQAATPGGPHTLIPAAEVELPFEELRNGRLTRELPVGRQVDGITIQVVDANGPMDQQLEFADLSDPRPGDYYYVRVLQLDGARAWSSPIWVGGEARR
jgi:hypothetical protein